MIDSASRRTGILLFGTSALLLLAACEKTQVTQGECRPVNGADVCTWVRTKGNSVLSFGATVPMGAISNAPADAPMVWPPVAAATIALPEAVTTATGLKVLTVYWEAHGHPPAPFMTPHFDFHFYNMATADIAAMDCSDLTKPASPPASYELPDIEIPGIGMLTGLCVAGMGMHALPSAEMAGTAPFRGTMVIGYYHAKPIFIEPMISQAALQERKNFELPIPVVADLPAGVHYPTQFRAAYDSTAQSYRFIFAMPKM